MHSWMPSLDADLAVKLGLCCILSIHNGGASGPEPWDLASLVLGALLRAGGSAVAGGAVMLEWLVLNAAQMEHTYSSSALGTIRLAADRFCGEHPVSADVDPDMVNEAQLPEDLELRGFVLLDRLLQQRTVPVPEAEQHSVPTLQAV